MNTTAKVTIFMVLLAALAFPAGASARQISAPTLDDRAVFGGEYTLKKGEVLDGSLLVFGGNVLLEEGSQVNGEVLSFGGNLDVKGRINGSLIGFGIRGVFSKTSEVGGDLVDFGGNLQVDGEVGGTVSVFGGWVGLGSTAVVRGDLITPGTSLERAEGSTVKGEVVTESGPVRVDIPSIPPLPEFNFPSDNGPGVPVRFSPYSSAASFLFLLLRTFVFSTLALLIALLLPENTRRAGNAVAREPVISGGLGLSSVVVVPILLLILGFTIILIPLSLLGMMLLVVAIVFGLIAIGLEVGDRLAVSLKQDWSPPLAAGIGTFALTLVLGLVGQIPCIGWLGWVILGAMGLGGVLLTRFGAREYVGARASAEVLEAEAAAPEPEVEEKPKPRRKSTKKTE